MSECGEAKQRWSIGEINGVASEEKVFNELDGTQGEIKDSGERTNFNTGAVRDMHQGKGRYDLLPWEAIHELALHCEEGAIKYGERNCEKGIPIHSFIDSAMRHMSCYSRGMKDEHHLRAALWNISFAIWTEIKHPEMQDIPERLTFRTDSAEDELRSEGYGYSK